MKKREWILQRMAESADLESELLPGQTLVEIAGDGRVLIENHSGVTEYGCEKIQVRVSYGLVCVTGRCLILCEMTKHQLVISGSVEAVTLLRGDGR